MSPMAKDDGRKTQYAETLRISDSTLSLLRELVAHLRENRSQLRQEWARRITESQFLTAMSQDEVFAEATTAYDSYVGGLETGSGESLQSYAPALSHRIIPPPVATHQ